MTTEERIKTWTFDEACTSMETNKLHKAEVSITTSADEESSLIILGLLGPEESEASEVTLIGKAKELDEELGGCLAEAMIENLKSFKHGASVGSTIPTIRVVTAEKKVRYFIFFTFRMRSRQ